ncbi:MAG: hypothetical protein ABII01_02140 [Candidatus Woesearchaeota archaeon]
MSLRDKIITSVAAIAIVALAGGAYNAYDTYRDMVHCVEAMGDAVKNIHLPEDMFEFHLDLNPFRNSAYLAKFGYSPSTGIESKVEYQEPDNS